MADYLSNPKAKPYLRLIERISAFHALPRDLLGSMAQRESQFDPHAVSPVGAKGIMQLMPLHKEVDREDPVASLQYGAKYLVEQHKRFGNWDEALAAYNWGPTNVARAKRQYGDQWLDHAPEETRNYVAALRPGKTESNRGRPSEIDALVSKYSTKDK